MKKGYCRIARDIRKKKIISITIYFDTPGRRPSAFYYQDFRGRLKLKVYLGRNPNLNREKLSKILCCSVYLGRNLILSSLPVYILLLVAIIYSAVYGRQDLLGLFSIIAGLGFILSMMEGYVYSKARGEYERCRSLLASSKIRLSGLDGVVRLLEDAVKYANLCKEKGSRKCSGILASPIGRYRVTLRSYRIYLDPL